MSASFGVGIGTCAEAPVTKGGCDSQRLEFHFMVHRPLFFKTAVVATGPMDWKLGIWTQSGAKESREPFAIDG
jgi:hypothetical protein